MFTMGKQGSRQKLMTNAKKRHSTNGVSPKFALTWGINRNTSFFRRYYFGRWLCFIYYTEVPADDAGDIPMGNWVNTFPPEDYLSLTSFSPNGKELPIRIELIPYISRSIARAE